MEQVIILGSGCAGLSAAVYAARAGLSPLVIEGAMPGGLITTTSEVENFPGFPDGIDGVSLVMNMRAQAEKFGARFESDVVERVELSAETKKLFASSGKIFECRALIVATGASPKLTGVKGEKELLGGNGVSTCATCDGAFFRGRSVAVIGGGDAACEEASFLTRFAAKVYLVHRRDKFRAAEIMVRRVSENPKIELVLSSVPEEMLADENGRARALRVRSVATGETRDLDVQGIFVAIGHAPNTAFLAGALPLEADGTISALRDASGVRTEIPGVYVAGDCADRLYRQAVIAAGTGARAALEAQRFLEA
ncbi:MAG TPA: thioredoxin-disulfide reductase [Candidatus Spyradosoma merdigallinarum]|uniref:Thioredoxin reductase n=1 Tax=Candidatus Spyradosoma merdigallinarum TaxID=2840950 RepID=A0A9D1T0L9_9BACT|nr:thioredoxin-disulfide reductase [Candidatus Spyradosoma merdigallinarum]